MLINDRQTRRFRMIGYASYPLRLLIETGVSSSSVSPAGRNQSAETSQESKPNYSPVIEIGDVRQQRVSRDLQPENTNEVDLLWGI
ncbi:unnamed protein product [Protopolystoma xenopodis]|uniref:Uncharacterized protein n=1 Tax=Protopolystoma xenopodis TaxID=117903 RepID=A0A3S4ZVF5_9PLAT|nr:unnamed protein product [Protopolystoma xenopodis]